MFEKLDDFLHENMDKINVTGGVSDDKIKEIESNLGLSLCGPYKAFLLKYGFIMGFGFEINGCGKNGQSQLVDDTVRYRQFGLENNFLVMTDLGEYIYCLDNDKDEVYSWYRDDCSYEREGFNFEDFILIRLEDGKDNTF